MLPQRVEYSVESGPISHRTRENRPIIVIDDDSSPIFLRGPSGKCSELLDIGGRDARNLLADISVRDMGRVLRCLRNIWNIQYHRDIQTKCIHFFPGRVTSEVLQYGK